MEDRSHGAQQVNRADDQSAPAAKDSNQSQRRLLPGTEEDRHFTCEIGKSRQSTTRESRHHQRRTDEWKFAKQSAKILHLERAGLLMQISAKGKCQRSQKTVRDH